MITTLLLCLLCPTPTIYVQPNPYYEMLQDSQRYHERNRIRFGNAMEEIQETTRRYRLEQKRDRQFNRLIKALED